MKYAVLSMDVEDWFHLDYFGGTAVDRSVSLLDGVETYCSWLAGLGLPSSFFVLGELAGSMGQQLRSIAAAGHDLGSHGWNHVRPLTVPPAAFQKDLVRSKHALEDIVGREVQGFR